MRARSYVDPVVQVPVIQVDLASLDELNTKSRTEWLEAFQEWRRNGGKKVAFHENFHFWQCLALPYLQWYAFVAFHAGDAIIHQAIDLMGHPQRWSPHLAFEIVRNPIRALEHQTHASFNEGTGDFNVWRHPGAFGTAKVSFSLIDLLENAAAVADFQATCPRRDDFIDPRKFRRWKNRTAAHTKVIDFIAAVLGPTLALRCAMAVIHASFHTTDPARTFIELLSALNGMKSNAFFAQPEPVRWRDFLLEHVLKACPLVVANDDDFLRTTSPGDAPYQRIRLDAASQLPMGNGRGHPVTGNLVSEWIESERRIPGFDSVLFQLGWASDSLLDELERFRESIYQVVLRFNDEPVASFLARTPWSPSAPAFAEEHHIGILAMSAHRSLALSLFSLEEGPITNLCRHKQCEWHAGARCKSFAAMPSSNHRSCVFPEFADLLVENHSKRSPS